MKDTARKRVEADIYKKYGFRTNVAITPGEAQKYDKIINGLAKLEMKLKTSWPNDTEIVKTMLVDQHLRETAITIRRTPKNLIELFTDTNDITTFITKIMKFTSVRYHEKNNSYAYFKIRSLAITMTPHNIHRLVAAIKGMTHEQFNVLLQQTDPRNSRQNNPFKKDRTVL